MSLESDLFNVEGIKVLLSLLTMTVLFIYNVLQAVLLLLTPRRYRTKKDITGQKVLITGAGNGLGRELAIQFSKHCTYLLLLDIDMEALQETSRLLDPCSRAFLYECDVTRREMVYSVAEKIKDEVGDVDILVNNAGTVTGKSLIDLPDEGIKKTLEVNVLSHFWTCKAFVPSMMTRNSGHIVPITSVAGRIPVAKLADYCASKCAAIGFAESLELEMRAKNLDGIKVTIICPFVINTGLFQGIKANLCRNLSPEYVAGEIMEGILMEMETVFIPGYFKYLTMLNSVIPRWLLHAYLQQTGNLNVMDTFVGRRNI